MHFYQAPHCVDTHAGLRNHCFFYLNHMMILLNILKGNNKISRETLLKMCFGSSINKWKLILSHPQAHQCPRTFLKQSFKY